MNKKIIIISLIAAIIFTVVTINQLTLSQTDEEFQVINESVQDTTEMTNPILNKTNEELNAEVEQKYDQLNTDNTNYVPSDRTWPSSGPFKIDRDEYIMGEKIFLIADGLDFSDKGKIVFYRPLNETHYKFWKEFSFDGMQKTAFNIYFEPKLSKEQEICSKDDLIGKWIIDFENTNYNDLRFSIIDKILPGDYEKYSKNVC